MTASNPTTVERDPVCGMNVNPATAKHSHEHQGKTMYFCCAHCLEKFKASPQQYLAPRSSGLVTLGMPKAAAQRGQDVGKSDVKGAEGRSYVCPMCPEVHESKPGACPSCGMALEPEVPLAGTHTEYTCPMHPEIVRSAPGSCPICGMALEPRTVTAAEENPELRGRSRRFWISVILTVPLLALSMGSMIWHGLLGESHSLVWIEFALATPVVLWCGLPFFQRFWISLVNRSPNMFTLIGLGTGVAYIYSVVATLAPQIFPKSLTGIGGHSYVSLEAVA